MGTWLYGLLALTIACLAAVALRLRLPASPVAVEGQEREPRRVTALAVVGLWLVLLGAVLLAPDSPLWRESARGALTLDDAVAAGLLLGTRYAPGLVALGLLALTLLVGQRLDKEADS